MSGRAHVAVGGGRVLDVPDHHAPAGRTAYAERRSSLLPATPWVARTTAGETTDVLPDGCMDVIWDGESLLVAGPDTWPHRADVPGTRFAAVRFDPGVAAGVLGVAAGELRDRRVALDEVLPALRVRRWCDALRGRPDAAAVLETLVAEVSVHRAAPPWVAPVVASLRSGASVGASALAVALSERELRRRSSAVFGYGPKTLQRVLRVVDATAAVAAGADPSAAAARHGYADYPHLHRECRAILWRSPATFRPTTTPQPAGGSAAKRSTTVPSGSWSTA